MTIIINLTKDTTIKRLKNGKTITTKHNTVINIADSIQEALEQYANRFLINPNKITLDLKGVEIE